MNCVFFLLIFPYSLCIALGQKILRLSDCTKRYKARPIREKYWIKFELQTNQIQKCENGLKLQHLKSVWLRYSRVSSYLHSGLELWSINSVYFGDFAFGLGLSFLCEPSLLNEAASWSASWGASCRASYSTVWCWWWRRRLCHGNWNINCLLLALISSAA